MIHIERVDDENKHEKYTYDITSEELMDKYGDDMNINKKLNKLANEL